jgi:RNA polymerase sigma-70 factor (ECF subfamily)
MLAMRRISGDGGLAEDAVQEAFLSLWAHPPESRSDTSLRAWLLVAARHALIRRWHRDTRGRADVPLTTLGLEAGWGDAELNARAESALASRQCLERGFSKVGPEAREVLVLVDIEELPLADAARTLGISLAALKSRLHRARLDLIAALTREDCHGP